jgi:hypothetical protein
MGGQEDAIPDSEAEEMQMQAVLPALEAPAPPAPDDIQPAPLELPSPYKPPVSCWYTRFYV